MGNVAMVAMGIFSHITPPVVALLWRETDPTPRASVMLTTYLPAPGASGVDHPLELCARSKPTRSCASFSERSD